MLKNITCLLLILLLLPTAYALASMRCIDADGEAALVNGDLPSAKAEAISRAKLTAIEQTVGVGVNAQTVVQNLMLVDESVNRKIYGLVASFKLLHQQTVDNVVAVKINACVEPAKARDAVSDLAMNNAVAVFIPARKLPARGASAGYQESNIFSEEIIGDLSERGYTVVDVDPVSDMNPKDIDEALKSGNFRALSSMMYKYLTNILLVGKIDLVVATKKGGDIGFGLNTPFNNVTARLTYRLVTRDTSGNMLILAAGSEQGKGLAGTMEDAVAKSMQNLAVKLKPIVAEKIGRHLKAAAKRVQVKVDGITELGDNFAVKEALQNIAWVTGVEEKELGSFVVSYTENTIYLANSLAQKGTFQIVNFSANAVTVKYKK